MTQKSFIEKELEKYFDTEHWCKEVGFNPQADNCSACDLKFVKSKIQSASKEFKRRVEDERGKLGKLEQLTYERIYEIAEGVFGRIE